MASYPMIDVPTAVSIVLEKAGEIMSSRRIESCSTQAALGRVLAENFVAPHSFPPFPASVLDGLVTEKAECSNVF